MSDGPSGPTGDDTEGRLGVFVADALGRIERGEPVVVAELLADRPDLVERGRRLARDLADFRRPLPPPSCEPPPSAVLPQPFPTDFLVTRLLGEGTYGRVWLAEDLHLPRRVALKTIRVPAGSDLAADALDALRREAGFLTALNHPNVVRVHAWRQAGGDHYLVLEYVPGGSFADLLDRDGPLPWDRAAGYVADVAEGLLAAHAAGVVHRDVKPGNILWDSEADEAKLTDFGVAARLADAGTAIGTTAYMAPEAFRGRATASSDVYGLAATLFRMVTGEVPFRAATRDEQERLAGGGLPDLDPRLAAVPAALEDVIRAGLAADAGRRPPLREFSDGLRGGFNQSIADNLAGADAGAVGLRLVVSRETTPGRWKPVAATSPPAGRLRRDMRKVPREPDRVRVRTGEWVRVEVAADRDGFVTVFNVGPTGNLNLLYPDHPAAAGSPPDVRAGQSLLVTDVLFAPPAGRERVFAVWSREPLPLTERTLRSLAAEGGTDTSSRPYRASRDLRRVKQLVTAGPAASNVAVLELAHDAPE